MYKDYFALTGDVFGVHPSGSDTFMGSQQAGTRDRLVAALSSGDTIVTVTGPVGSGKTTMVREALNAIPGKQKVTRIARIKLAHDEVLELLMVELGVEEQPVGTIRRFTEFKRLLKEWQDQGTRVFIIVEDAKRIGVDAISELESLTSIDAGGAAGASIVLMGMPEVDELLTSPELARTKQRISLQLSLEPFAAADVKDYLTNRFVAAGGNVDVLFETGAIDMIHRCSGGIPGVINKLCEATLNAAANENSNKISAALVQAVAARDFGLQPDSTAALPFMEPNIPDLIQDTMPCGTALAPQSQETRSVPATGTTILEPQTPERLTKTTADTDSVRQLDSALLPDTNLLRVLAELPPPIEDNAAVPLGLQDSTPARLAEKVAATTAEAPATTAPDANSENASAPKETLPTQSDSIGIDPLPRAPDATNSGDTGTLRKPNIEAFETAMATARKGPVELDRDAEPAASEASAEAAKEAEPEPVSTAARTAAQLPASDGLNLPEITLDSSLKERQREAETLLEEKRKAQQEVAAKITAKADEKRERAKLGKLASDLGKAKSLEEIDDMAAETLFGEEFSQMAAAVVAMAAEAPANDATIRPTTAAEEASDDKAERTVSTDTQPADETTPDAAVVSFESMKPGDALPAPDIDSSASRRFAMVRKMNTPAADKPVEPSAPPEQEASGLTPIENQFGLSMTQTLSELKFEKPEVEHESESGQSGGFLSRFKRS